MRKWGPIWVTGAFYFEFWNRRIVENVTSPNAVCDHIVIRFLISRFVKKVARNDTVSDIVKKFISNIMNLPVLTQDPEIIRFRIIEKDQERPFSDVERDTLPQEFDTLTEVMFYNKVSINGIDFECSSRNPTQHCDSVICLDKNKCGEITSIVQFRNQDQIVRGLFVNLFCLEGTAFGTQYLETIRRLYQLIFVQNVDSITPGFIMTRKGQLYSAKIANTFETD